MLDSKTFPSDEDCYVLIADLQFRRSATGSTQIFLVWTNPCSRSYSPAVHAYEASETLKYVRNGAILPR